jgi:hypothetical protein
VEAMEHMLPSDSRPAAEWKRGIASDAYRGCEYKAILYIGSDAYRGCATEGACVRWAVHGRYMGRYRYMGLCMV